MSHEITATRRYVDEAVRKPASDLASHIGDLLSHVSAEDRARWDSSGRDGRDGVDGHDGAAGKDGQDGAAGKDGQDGADGKSAYEIACDNGFDGTAAEWLESLKAKVTFDALTPDQKASLRGDDGKDGRDGVDGTSVYVQSYEANPDPGGVSVLVLNDGRDTRIEIHNGRDGTNGANGKSAYEVACDNGFVGTEAEWIASMRGADGRDGTVSIDSLTVADREELLGSVQDYISEDPAFVGEKGKAGERGSRWHASDVGMFSGNDTTPGNFSGVGAFADVAQPGDMLLMTSAHKIYECIAARGETYDGKVQAQPLWAYRMAVVGKKGDKGDKGDMSTFVPADTFDGMVNQSSVWEVAGGTLEFPCPTVPAGQLLEYVLYVKAATTVTIDPATSFSKLTEAGYTVYSNNNYNLMDTLPATSVAAFMVSQMGKSKNVSIMRVLFGGNAIAAPAAQ